MSQQNENKRTPVIPNTFVATMQNNAEEGVALTVEGDPEGRDAGKVSG